MSKIIWSVLILIVTVTVSIILYNVVLNKYPTWGTFENLVFLGLVTFGLGLGIFISAILIERSIRETIAAKSKG